MTDPKIIDNLKKLTYYHGSPVLINDIALATGTWLTEDIDIARLYGKFVYKLEIPERYRNIIEGPNWEGHFVTKGQIPIEYLCLTTEKTANPEIK